MESGFFFFVTTETLGQWKEQQLLPEWDCPGRGQSMHLRKRNKLSSGRERRKDVSEEAEIEMYRVC